MRKRGRPITPSTREAIRLAVVGAIETLPGDLHEMWAEGRGRVIRHVLAHVRAHVEHPNKVPLTDEVIVDVLVAELRQRFVEITEVEDEV